jgi:hypothetical protein
MLQAEHCFWYHREAPDARNPKWMASLTKLNRANFGHLRAFFQMYTIENLRSRKGDLRGRFLRTPAVSGDFQPRVFHVTIRHTDWWNWESEQPLRFEDKWFQAMLDTPDLRSTHILKLELETLDYKVNQLLPIVERIKAMESKEMDTHVVEGKPTPTRFVLYGEPKVYTWSGPTDINGHTFSHYGDKTALNYHVITLQWRLHFPEHPRANVQSLRCAPRYDSTKEEELSDEDRAPIHLRPHYLRFRPRAPAGHFHLPGGQRDIMRTNVVRDEATPGPSEAKKPKEGPAMLGNMIRTYRKTLEKDQYRADIYEVRRRGLFAEGMAAMRARNIEERWRAEGSLLKFEE